MEDRSHKIMIIDDEEIVRKVCRMSIQKLGCEVLAFENGVQALECLQKGGVDVVFTDLKMPIMDGIEVLKAIKRDFPFVEVVIMTGYGTVEDAINAMKNGAYDFILKPIKPDQLRVVAQKCFEKLQLSAENKALRIANQKLLDLQKMKDKFIAITSHELRTPVSHLKGYVGILNDNIFSQLSDKEKNQCMSVILNSVTDLEEIVNNMHNLTQLESGQMDLQRERIELNELIDQIIFDYEIIMKRRNHALKLMKSVKHLPIIADPKQIKSVFSELLQNAIKFTPDGGEICVTTGIEGDYSVVRIKDNGIGIDTRDQGNIFEKFYEVEDSNYHSTSKMAFKGGGLGLGLPSVRAITTAHGGGIKVKSKKNQGTEFFVYLPLDKESKKQANG